MRYVGLDNITDDMVLAQSIKDEYGRVLITEGSKLSPQKREKLRWVVAFATDITVVMYAMSLQQRASSLQEVHSATA